MAADKVHENLLFLTPKGLPLLREDATKGSYGKRIDYVTLWFSDLVTRAGLAQMGRGYYSLRHTWYTIGSQTTDMQAVSRSAGHKLGGMADTYCQTIGDEGKAIARRDLELLGFKSFKEIDNPPAGGSGNRRSHQCLRYMISPHQ